MHRTQINLDDWQYESLKAWADRQQRSVSEVVREAVAEYLVHETGKASQALEELAGFAEDSQATGQDHDRYLYEET